ncbi:hypothetical protein DL96DRAFT_1565273 [Flagelloscypha sp. PMI_526]|nr:hypothetical protein DL96DRAFT_1565273 [Flagelloscypha sp. PMI_526]
MGMEDYRVRDLKNTIARTVNAITTNADRLTTMALCRVSKLLAQVYMKIFYDTTSLHETEGAQRFPCATTHRPSQRSLVRFLEYRLLDNLISLTSFGHVQPPTFQRLSNNFECIEDYHLTVPEESLDRVPCKMALEILDLTIGCPKDRTLFFRGLDLAEFASFQYLGFSSEWGALIYYERKFVDIIEQEVIPFFLPTFKVFGAVEAVLWLDDIG